MLGGHSHNDERFAPQDPHGEPDSDRGLRQFVVGSSGRNHHGLALRKWNSEVFDATAYGVLKLTLSSEGYAWEFIPETGKTFTDAGSGRCH